MIPTADGLAPPRPVAGGNRETAVDVHQLRAGHWTSSILWRHRVGQAPTRDCDWCEDKRCPAALCLVCREEADTPEHILLRCPALIATRFRRLGTIVLSLEDVRGDDVVAALGASYRSLLSRTATPR